MKKFILGAITVLLIAFIIVQTGLIMKYDWSDLFSGSKKKDTDQKIDSLTYASAGNIHYRVKAEGNYFYFYNKVLW